MLNGHVFKNQRFGNQIFALFINTFLDGHNGIIDDYKNSMSLSYNGSELTVGSGAVCVQGRFLEEDSSTTLNTGTNTLYCKLVIEIDLDKDNTETEFNQAKYKILKGETNYPSLTQDNIVNNNSGVYQYELARFRTGLSGISNFEDKRSFLDFKSIYTELEEQTNLATKNELKQYLKLIGGVITGTITFEKVVKMKSSVEMYGKTPYIDFHYNDSTSDYTSRIWENTNKHLSLECMQGVNLGCARDKMTCNGVSFDNLFALNSNSKYKTAIAWQDSGDLLLTINGGAVAKFQLLSASDKRLKKDISEINENVINAIGELKLKQFRLKRNNPDGKFSFGVIAQDLIASFEKYNLDVNDYDLIKTIVLEDEIEYYIVDYEQFNTLRLAYLESKLGG